MINIILDDGIKKRLTRSCAKAGSNECGGILFGRHVAENTFKIEEITADPRKGGAFAVFVRDLKWNLRRLSIFFNKHNNNFTKFNYLGEWHSHPQFQLIPSSRDHQTMIDIITDPSVGANFVILMIVKIENSDLKAKCWAYFPNQIRTECHIVFEN